MSLPKNPIAGRLRVLDSLRGIGALVVVLYHVEVWNHVFTTPWFRHVMSLMDFFFVLSGFVVSLGFYEKVRDRRTLIAYLIRRVGRLWPLHISMLAAFVVLEIGKAFSQAGVTDAFSGPKSVTALVANVFMVQAWGLFPRPTWNYPAWSISAEFSAYLAFGLFALWAPRRPVLMALLIVAATLVVLARFSPHYMDADTDYGVPRCLAGFFAGHCLYHLHMRVLRHRRWRLPWPTLVECLSLVAFVLFVAFANRGPATLLGPLFYALFVLVFALEDGRISALLSWERIRILGEYSYSIYMVHAFLLVLATSGLAFFARRTGRDLTYSYPDGIRTVPLWNLCGPWVGDCLTFLFLAATIAVAAFTFRRIEQPGRRLFNAWAKSFDTAVESAIATKQS